MRRTKKARSVLRTQIPRINFRFLNKSQSLAWDTIDSNYITFISGPAGSSKSFLATAYAIQSVLDGHTEGIMLTRPAVEAGERLGAIPGGVQEKVGEYLRPIFDIVSQLCGDNAAAKAIISDAVQIEALAYLRGHTVRNAVAILDEAQNVTLAQMKMYLSRLGENSKLIICGDGSQSDIGKNTTLIRTAERLAGVNGVGWFEFSKSDIVRHPLIQEILERMEDL